MPEPTEATPAEAARHAEMLTSRGVRGPDAEVFFVAIERTAD